MFFALGLSLVLSVNVVEIQNNIRDLGRRYSRAKDRSKINFNFVGIKLV
jgi:hypothetical protein